MREWVTRITTSPGERSSRPISSKRGLIFPASEWMRNALKRFMASPFRVAELTDAHEPGHEALCIEDQIAFEGVLEVAVRQAAAVSPRERAPQRKHIGADAARRLGVRGMRACDGRQLADLLFEGRCQTRNVGHAAEVHEINRLGPEPQHAVDGGYVLLRVELRRLGGR